MARRSTKVLALESSVPMGAIAGQRGAGRGVKATNWQDRLMLDRVEKAEFLLQQKLQALEKQKQAVAASQQPATPPDQYWQQAVLYFP